MATDVALRSMSQEPVEAAGQTRRIAGFPTANELTRRQKAAIVVRLLLAEGAKLPLSELPEPLQAELTTQMSQMRFVDRTTLREVIEEFASELDSIGLSFPDGLEGVLKLLDGAISPEMAARLRMQSGVIWGDDPWDTIALIEPERLLPVLERESAEVGAIILSKLKVMTAAQLLGQLPGPRARRLSLAVSETANVSPDTVRRIGLALAADLQAEPPREFPAAAVERLGAILNFSQSVTREDVLAGLDEEDSELAEQVRRTIFTFEDVPARIAERDVPFIVKAVDQDQLVIAIAGATPRTQAAVDFLLANMSKRMADMMREGAADLGKVAPKEAEASQTAIVGAIRDAIERGEIQMIDPDADKDDAA
ncbi:flagellar motor switch protein FliG [Palleronia aestuarii]|uniref:Flagellar motor switch protein FliG n=1 Tax=Palleronia aestuarii TaxID=568105 RepID=A0A2W7NBQ5_9RHOB|nr:FliG C-terminal domain-containing protein [Palleronia aestuarii]PZX17578.1 flagellar motor switch protein FliG [Palleronia aestuarii]